MALTGSRTYVGFGFGPIQAGLFLHEAQRSGAFGRLVVAEVVPDVVAAVRAAGGGCSVNVAHRDRIEQVALGPVEIVDPTSPGAQRVLVEAVAAAEELATAVPSVDHYLTGDATSIRQLLAAGLRAKAAGGGPRAVVYAAENHNHAAEILERAVLDEVPACERAAVSASVRFLNTVIGKMSRVVAGVDELGEHDLDPIAPGLERAFLVEAFNRILVSRVRFPDAFARGISAFEEKDDLLPFEEAKLYGHNATHALGGYLAAVAGVRLVADLGTVPGLLPFLRDAFLEESGGTLLRRHDGVDPLFTPAGYRAFADDLLERMTNPLLLDTVERVTRDPARKLGWADRLVGTIRIAREAGIDARRYAFGAAAAAVSLDPGLLEPGAPSRPALEPLWAADAADDAERRAVLAAVDASLVRLRSWRESGFGDVRAAFGDRATSAASERPHADRGSRR